MSSDNYWSLYPNDIHFEMFRNYMAHLAISSGPKFFEDNDEFSLEFKKNGFIFRFSDDSEVVKSIDVEYNIYSCAYTKVDFTVKNDTLYDHPDMNSRKFNGFIKNFKKLLSVLGLGYFYDTNWPYIIDISEDGDIELTEKRNEKEDFMSISVSYGTNVNIAKWKPMGLGAGLVNSRTIYVSDEMIDAKSITQTQRQIHSAYMEIYEETIKTKDKKGKYVLLKDFDAATKEDEKGKVIGELASKFFRIFAPRIFNPTTMIYPITVFNVNENFVGINVWLYKDSEFISIGLGHSSIDVYTITVTWKKAVRYEAYTPIYEAVKSESISISLVTNADYIAARNKAFKVYTDILQERIPKQ